MPQPLIWLPDAVDDLARLRQFIAEHSQASADRAARRIQEGVRILMELPEAGKPLEDEELTEFRDLVVPFGSGAYVLRYRLDKGSIIMVRVWHSREGERKKP
ncbi:MAG: type II toxin-antitoxin system RelE/ParE family toxin [Acidobacteria bacterium]|nr:type II toxin-antitoxin system RelE/ParE family toxin [Acidobacteriota bacterium]